MGDRTLAKTFHKVPQSHFDLVLEDGDAGRKTRQGTESIYCLLCPWFLVQELGSVEKPATEDKRPSD